MAKSFFSTVKKATPKPSLKLVDSPFGKHYLKIDDGLLSCIDLRVEGVKAFFRSYQNYQSTLHFTIEEVERLISKAKEFNESTDEFFDNLLLMSKDNAKSAFLLSCTFAYLRNELPTSK